MRGPLKISVISFNNVCLLGNHTAILLCCELQGIKDFFKINRVRFKSARRSSIAAVCQQADFVDIQANHLDVTSPA